MKAVQRRTALIDIIPMLTAGNKPVLDHLGQSADYLCFGKGMKKGIVAQHKIGLVETADKVLVSLEIHTVLTPHTGIHLREKGCSHEAEREPPHVYGSGKTCQVTYHASANPHQV